MEERCGSVPFSLLYDSLSNCSHVVTMSNTYIFLDTYIYLWCGYMVGRYLGVHDDGGKSDGSFGGKNTLTCRGTGWLVGDGECKHFISCVNILCICLHRVHVKITVANQILVPRQNVFYSTYSTLPPWAIVCLPCSLPTTTKRAQRTTTTRIYFCGLNMRVVSGGREDGADIPSFHGSCYL